jgi:tRNA (cytidine56-2'-O)-methyltransferase
MPGEVFKLADWNVSVTNQPMSEVAALSVFLDWHLKHSAFDKNFPNSEVRIVPSRDQKKIQRLSLTN